MSRPFCGGRDKVSSEGKKKKLGEAVNLPASRSCVGKQAFLSRGMIPPSDYPFIGGRLPHWRPHMNIPNSNSILIQSVEARSGSNPDLRISSIHHKFRE